MVKHSGKRKATEELTCMWKSCERNEGCQEQGLQFFFLRTQRPPWITQNDSNILFDTCGFSGGNFYREYKTGKDQAKRRAKDRSEPRGGSGRHRAGGTDSGPGQVLPPPQPGGSGRGGQTRPRGQVPGRAGGRSGLSPPFPLSAGGRSGGDGNGNVPGRSCCAETGAAGGKRGGGSPGWETRAGTATPRGPRRGEGAPPRRGGEGRAPAARGSGRGGRTGPGRGAMRRSRVPRPSAWRSPSGRHGHAAGAPLAA